MARKHQGIITLAKSENDPRKLMRKLGEVLADDPNASPRKGIWSPDMSITTGFAVMTIFRKVTNALYPQRTPQKQAVIRLKRTVNYANYHETRQLFERLQLKPAFRELLS